VIDRPSSLWYTKKVEFYTYLWLRYDGTPYYVGKGCGRRAYQSNGGRTYRPPNDTDRILIQGHASEEDAFFAEKFLIALWGRLDLSTGILRNLTDGGEGTSNPSERVRQLRRERGLQYVDSGQMAKLQKMGGLARGSSEENLQQLIRMRTKDAQIKGGKIRGQMDVDSGKIFHMATPASCALGGKTACHIRHHVKRGIVNPTCSLCL